MALPVNIDDLINRRIVENARIEYKSEWNPEPIMHSICAFANDIDNWGGGYIVIGVEERDGIPVFPIKGIQKNAIDSINKELLQYCNLIEPRYIPVVEHVSFNGTDLLILWIPGGENRPYKCPVKLFPQNSKKEYAYYIRKMSNSIRANGSEEKELIQLSENIPFDDRMNVHAEVRDLKSSLISEFLGEVKSDLYEKSLDGNLEEIGLDMRIVAGAVEWRKPVNVGLMFFNDRPDSFFPYARIELVDKPDETGLGMTEKICSGPLHRQLTDALSYIRNYIIKEKIEKVKGQAEAQRVFNFPYEAVEEALCNAVYHKSYQIGEPVTVMVTPQKMEITSLPGPDRTISDDDLRECHLVSRRYRNRRIGDFLKELKLIEGRNTGVPTILRAMQQNGSPKPLFLTDSERSYFTTVLPVHSAFIIEETQANLQKSAPEKKRRSLEEIEELILKILSEQGATATAELAALLGYTKVTETLRKAIKELIADGAIAYTEKKNSRNQKLTFCSDLQKEAPISTKYGISEKTPYFVEKSER